MKPPADFARERRDDPTSRIESSDDPTPAPRSNSGSRRRRAVAPAQGVFYVVSGVWPLIHLRSFLAVTGPKTDLWLVQTVGALLAVIGVSLVLGARRREPDPAAAVLGALSALTLALVDVVFVTQGVIGPIYLADAAVEALIVAAWGWAVIGTDQLRQNT